MEGIHQKDALYGQIFIPDYLLPLCQTQLAMRARDITMGTVPNEFRTNGALPSRFIHGLGGSHLARFSLFRNNPHLEDEQRRLIEVSMVMHDWGNPPFAHLIERLMREAINLDGESFLEVLLNEPIGRSTKQVLSDLGVSQTDVLAMITGQMKPFSDVVHGDIDLDNLDNVLRYALSVGCLDTKDMVIGTGVALSFFWNNKAWVFEDSEHEPNNLLKQLLLNWKRLRREVYEDISTSPHLVVGTMLFSAAWQAYENGLLKPEHFLLSDRHMLALLDKASPVMMEKLHRWQWFQEAYCEESTTPTERWEKIAHDTQYRMSLAHSLATKLRTDINNLTVYVGFNRKERKINVPVTGLGRDLIADDWLRGDKETTMTNPVSYKVQINLDPALGSVSRGVLEEFVHQEIK